MRRVLDWLRWRRRWTIAVVGRESGRETSLESIYRFRTAPAAMARAADLNRRTPSALTEYQARERPEKRWRRGLTRSLHRTRSGGNSRAPGAASREG